MGGSSSKEEEVIIAQAGNSGGQTDEIKQSFGASEITGIINCIAVLILLAIVIFKGIRKNLRKGIDKHVRKVATELSRQEQV